jgi:hypothetical protein
VTISVLTAIGGIEIACYSILRELSWAGNIVVADFRTLLPQLVVIQLRKESTLIHIY